ncbi:MAG: ribosomal RNA small subunit methyltransferase A, partial [Actinomycetota bacterium]
MTITLLGASEVRSLADELELRPTKSLGQNFVVDANTCKKIVRIADVKDGERVLEIGPGLGSLTLAILQATSKVSVIEIDTRLAQRLAQTVKDHGGAEIEIINLDALAIKDLQFPPDKLVANLP